jgi:hypothetical protein
VLRREGGALAIMTEDVLHPDVIASALDKLMAKFNRPPTTSRRSGVRSPHYCLVRKKSLQLWTDRSRTP